MKLLFATRASALALWQTRWVMQALQTVHPGLICEELILTTQGDRQLDRPLPEIGGKGLFTGELEAALLDGHVQAAVHSLKDLPVEDTPGLTIGAIPKRGDARDVLVSAHGFTLRTLPPGARVATSSLRRSAQLLSRRPDLGIESLRGNVDTRLRKALEGRYDAILLAGAGLIRLGLEGHVTEWLEPDVMLPAPGQGALAVQCRGDDRSTLNLLAALEDGEARRSVAAERQFLRGLGGGCSLPVAAHATVADVLHLDGLVASPDGRRVVRVSGDGADPFELGGRLARQALAQGADEILDKLPEAARR